jgi:hypothetical protein
MLNSECRIQGITQEILKAAARGHGIGAGAMGELLLIFWTLPV